MLRPIRRAATIAWTPGQRWLRISFIAQPYGSEWNYFLGHDPIARRWVLNYVASPSLTYSGAATARAWTGDRLIFTPTPENYKGFRGVNRFLIVRSSTDGFRIVSEVKMPSGKFVAMGDVLFSRRK